MNTENNVARVGRLVGRVAGFLPAAHYAVLGGAGAAVALAPAANASPIVSPVANLLIPVTTSGVYINVVTGVTSTTPSGSPGWDLNPWGSGSFFAWSSASGGVMTAPGGSTTLTGNLAIGTLVDGTGHFGTSNSSQFGAGQPGVFLLNDTDYIGFKFLDEGDGQTHYGWASITLLATANTAGRKVDQIYYESVANSGITVGDTGGSGAPEPSAAALLATGVAGLLALRRLRRQTS